MQIFATRLFWLAHRRGVAQIGCELFAASQGRTITVKADAYVTGSEHVQHFVFLTNSFLAAPNRWNKVRKFWRLPLTALFVRNDLGVFS